MTVSFGVEFEFDLIKPNNERHIGAGETPYYIAPNWDYQPDQSATCELRSPVFTSLEQFIREVNSQFARMVEINSRYIPYPFCERDRRLGQHMHIGLPDRRLTIRAKTKIAKLAVNFYPLLAALHAQPIPSMRALTSMYARSIAYYRSVIHLDHFCEISDADEGTVEFRIFDANIPQASLVCAWILTQIAKVALRNRREEDGSSFDFSAYDQERNRALRYGLVALEVTNYLRKLKEVIGAAEIPNIAAIKEALYLLARYRLNFYGVLKYTNVRHYDYFKAQYRDCSKFLENLLTIQNIQHGDKIRRWINEAQQIENLDQLIGLSIAVDRSLAEGLTHVVEDRAAERAATHPTSTTPILVGLTRSRVRESIINRTYVICRLGSVGSLSADEVAEHVSMLLRLHGEGVVNVLTANEIIRTPARFYVFVAQDLNTNVIQICGAIAINLQTGEISCLVVDRRFRRLGIARLLLEHVINVARSRGLKRVHAYVRKNNEASIALHRSLGFVESGRSDRAIKFVRELGGE